MANTDPPAVQDKNGIPPERNLREVIRFPSAAERRKAFQVLIDLRERHQFNTYNANPDEWWIYTDTLRKLRQHGVQFEWLTENI
jgi:hypothetical protein